MRVFLRQSPLRRHDGVTSSCPRVTGLLLPAALLASLLAAGGCKSAASKSPSPPVCDAAPFEDLDPAPSSVKVALQAAPADWDPGTGTPIHGFAYNGQTPGPTLVLDKGQLLHVDITNDLAEGTTIHWHGMRVPWLQDGVPGETQDPIPPGTTYAYEFNAPDPGIYWYHPHTMDGGSLIDHGLFGLIVVRDPSEPRGAAEGVDCDLPIALDDVDLDSHGQIRTDIPDPVRMNGHLGDLLLANGRTDLRIAMHPGGHDLLRLVNTSSARYFDLTIEGHTFDVVGSEGGWLPQPYTTDHLLIPPAERYQVIVHGTGEAGQSYAIVNHPHLTNPNEGDPLTDTTIATLVYDDTVVTTPAPTFPAAPLPAWTPTAPAHTYVLNESMTGTQMTETIDGYTWPGSPIVTFDASSGPVAVAIRNDAPGSHPMHFHGERLLVLQRNGVTPATSEGWKDTIDVSPGETVLMMSDFLNTGRWMFHCHILDHAEMGMMAEFNASAVLAPPAAPAKPASASALEAPSRHPRRRSHGGRGGGR